MLRWNLGISVIVFLTKEQSDARLKSESNLANRFGSGVKEENSVRAIPEPVKTIEISQPGKNRPNLTRDERTEIAIRARLGERQESLAEEFGVTTPNISSIKRGYNQANIDEGKVEQKISEVRDRALDRLMASMNLLDDDKLSGCSAKDLSVIAANMGRVVDKTLPKSESGGNINLIVYAPELRNERTYETKVIG